MGFNAFDGDRREVRLVVLGPGHGVESPDGRRQGRKDTGFFKLLKYGLWYFNLAVRFKSSWERV
ncbi:hypothetical protein PUN4_490123 [Paraburkholderia unamae]|nr:hypothetical protein PUN4_490123 [Paraburkholderia unamae]